MSLNDMNHLKFTINEHNYNGRDIYINLGIGAGYCIKKIWNSDNQKEVEINTSCVCIFLNYIKEIVNEEPGLKVDGTISKNVIHISMKTSKEEMDEDMQMLLDIIYRLPVDKRIFENAVKKTRSDFNKKIKDIAFQTRNKMMGFSDFSNSYNYKDYKSDLDKVTYEDFLAFFVNLITFENSYLFINGNIKTLRDFMFYHFINNEKDRKYQIKKFYEEKDIFLLTNQQNILKNYENYQIGCIQFDFSNQEFSITNKFVLLSIIASSLFQNKAEVNVDGLEPCILYYNQELAEYKKRIFDCFNSQNLKQIKNGILDKYSELLDKEPKKFGQAYVEMTMQGSDLEEYLNIIEQIDEKSVKDLYRKGDIKITERHLIY
ncbi:hypothetical protein [Anaerosacchariphilus polymeriproducens]|uniref:Uncharacterized protein n=1 Tax=Anaerosacchariphilus polymeriproducens TaxID=1812858 RepID=A0A371ARD2_9FIRM|nr:hypothetical protein [Anaerosacchariphilus polymeriproducens]RDU22135.1 hypothetical protein DWV06_16530 [Anaerosacchariphilus polymeriproducens]